ncbi:MAG: hypothetical protein PWQ96_2102 [Clostridia bacterium]|jgi:hypothetical protein|nr:hypothetical protein [Clostridiales bacterium]MDK2986458.1 hypothetical protein [Clostridia bacterium]
MNDRETLHEKIEKLSVTIEKMKLAEYVKLLESPWRLLYVNFLAGIARGFGMAVGFTILSGIVIYILQKLVILNLPLISDFIADIVRLVREQSY